MDGLIERIKWREVGDGYLCTEEYKYYSERYNKWIIVPYGFYSDGATYAPDIDSRAWGVHDVLCRFGIFDDGTRCTNWQASTILYDILMEDGHKIRAPWWRIMTFIFGGGAARQGRSYK